MGTFRVGCTVVNIAIGVHLVAYLHDRAFDPGFAATATGLIGAMQVAGRIVLKRGHGKLSFFTVRDGTGDIQLFLSQDEMGESYQLIDDLDLGLSCRVNISSLNVRVSQGSIAAFQFIRSRLRHSLYHEISGSRRNSRLGRHPRMRQHQAGER